MGAGNLALLHTEFLCEGLLQTGAIEGCKAGELVGLEAGVDESGKGGDVGGVEDDHDVLHVRAILLDVVAEFSCDLAVALEEILAGHTLLTGSAAGRNNVFSIFECHGGIDGGGNVGTLESAVVDLCKNTLEAGLIDIVKTYVRSETEHECGLGHVGANHSTCSYNDQLFVC